MIPGLRGRLITASFARDLLPAMPGFAVVPPHVSSRLHTWVNRLDSMLGPASSIRAITDVALVPLLEVLGFDVVGRADTPDLSTLHVAAGSAQLTALVAAYGEPVARLWRAAMAGAIAADARWALCCNARVLRLVDGRCTWMREYLEFDLALLGHDRDTQSVFWSLLRRDAFDSAAPLLDRAIESSARHGLAVCTALGSGMLDALDVLLLALTTRTRRRASALLFEQALTVLYRVLFLLFAEARGLVPIWHPIYRDRYSLEAIVATLLTGRGYRGLWTAVRAISRLAHTGFAAGELRVTAFNGRLFAPAHTDVFDGTPVSDSAMSRAVLAVSTTAVNRHGRRARIAYRDLDVEQLGAVYERVLEYEPSASGHAALTHTRDLRKASGTFYTPRAVTAHLVRRTLEPIVRGMQADEILAVRILDPAMGSGAFLVAACRFLSAAVEEALIREGRWHSHDITATDRASLRRQVASRCLFGVDLNPMAVQLARLSLWLATLAADKPLTFLDHHLLAGNSLVGATPDDLWRLPARPSHRPRRQELPLFDHAGLTAAFEHAVGLRLKLASEPDDTVAIVRAKEQALAALLARDASLHKWTRALDLWCARWFWNDSDPPDRGVFRELVSRVLTEQSTLPARVTMSLLDGSDAVATAQRFVHWPLAFPEVFVDRRGEPLADPGFDAVIGNPPWDMVRGDSGTGERRQRRRDDARRLTHFIRESGIYAVSTHAHANLYQWFVERALHLTRRGGRVGLVLPSGFATDAGAAALRRFVFDRADVDRLTRLDNREGIFPIHRSVRFDLVTCTTGRPTTSIECRFGVTRPGQLDGDDQVEDAPVTMTRPFIARLSGDDDLGIPELTCQRDVAIAERISATTPRLSHDSGWDVHFGRELNATDDRDAFEPFTGALDSRPVIEGKQIEPFRVRLADCRLQLRHDAAQRRAVARRARLTYRDVASARNRLTLIAAIVPPRAVTTHTLFCLKTRISPAEQQVLCALMNSFVANYLVRLRVNTHVTVALVSRLPVPVVREAHPLFDRLRTLTEAVTLGQTPVEDMPEYAQLQALAAGAYGLRPKEFDHIVATFPLIPERVRRAALDRFALIHDGR